MKRSVLSTYAVVIRITLAFCIVLLASCSPLVGVSEQAAQPNFGLVGGASTRISPEGGEFTGAVDVTISSDTAGAEIRYTLDGSAPDENSTRYTEAIRLDETTTIKARAFKVGFAPSQVSSATFTIHSVHVLPDNVVLEGDTLCLAGTRENSGIKVGDVVVGTAGRGYLRRIETIKGDPSGQALIMTTRWATLSNIVRNESLTIRPHLSPETAAVLGSPGGQAQLLEDRINLSGVIFEETSGVTVEIVSGSLDFSLDFPLEIDFGFLSVERFMFAAEGSFDLDIDVVASVNASGDYIVSTTLGEFEWVVKDITGSIPVVATIRMRLVGMVEIEAQATGTTTFGFNGETYSRLGAEYDGTTGDWVGIAEASQSFQCKQVRVEFPGGALVRMCLRPEFSVALYDVSGPLVRFEMPCAALSGSVSFGELDWQLDAYLTGEAGFTNQIPVIDWGLNELTATRFLDREAESPLCAGSTQLSPDIDNVELVGASGGFNTTDGHFEVTVIPWDSHGDFIGAALREDAFSFEHMVLDPLPGTEIPITATVTGVEVKEPRPHETVTAVVIFDSSGSMGSNDPGADYRRAGGQAFFDQLGHGDEVAIIDFGPEETNGLSASRLLQYFTSERELLDMALDALTNTDGTPLYASILDALNLLNWYLGGPGGVIVVRTDGTADDQSLFNDAVAQADQQDVPIYTIGLGGDVNFSRLRDLAQQTDGTFAEASDSAALQTAFEAIGSGVRFGKVTVFGRCTYDYINPGRYLVRGELVTQSGTTTIKTPFAFTTDAVP